LQNGHSNGKRSGIEEDATYAASRKDWKNEEPPSKKMDECHGPKTKTEKCQPSPRGTQDATKVKPGPKMTYPRKWNTEGVKTSRC